MPQHPEYIHKTIARNREEGQTHAANRPQEFQPQQNVVIRGENPWLHGVE